jgi:hypothetical protein
MTKKFILLITILGCLMNLAACSPYVTWNEEVKLNDGRVIVVEQRVRAQGPIPREDWLTINLPEFSQRPIVWHENLVPFVVNIDEGRLYVVGNPPTPFETRHYGCQSPPYLGFVWENERWNRIPFDKIPKEIYSTNMLIEGLPPQGTSLLTLEKKNSAELNGSAGLTWARTINPNSGSGC